ncbi:hypothetical protein [Lysinibacillus sp. LZ02]|uniref:hypothetical protein n=1 Tax=Lysinibacillus sp. LZ02 TaxID=3420668 RepID=UPI003D369408
MSVLNVISLLVIPFVSLWLVSMKEQKQLFVQLRQHFLIVVPNMYPHLGIILAASFFVQALHQPIYVAQLNTLFTRWNSLISGEWWLIVALMLVLILSIVGVHIFVAFTLTINIFQPSILNIHSGFYSICMLLMLAIATMISPFNGSNSLMGSLRKESTFVICRRNLPTALTLLILLIGLVLFI